MLSSTPLALLGYIREEDKGGVRGGEGEGEGERRGEGEGDGGGGGTYIPIENASE